MSMRHGRLQRLLFLGLILCSLCLTACSRRAVVEDVSQGEANRIVALLNGFGIHSLAEKGSRGRASYRVEVKQSDYTQAVSLLASHEMPGEQRLSFGELIEQKGLVPNSREVEALRLDHAMAVELEDALENHPSVVRARVVIRSHAVSKDVSPGASVVIQRYADREVEESSIQRLVMSSVPGLSEENISISIAPFEIREGPLQRVGVLNDGAVSVAIPLVPFLTWSIPEDDLYDVMVTLLLLAASALIVGGGVGYLLGNRKGSMSDDTQALPDGPVSLRLDSPESDLPEVR